MEDMENNYYKNSLRKKTNENRWEIKNKEESLKKDQIIGKKERRNNYENRNSNNNSIIVILNKLYF